MERSAICADIAGVLAAGSAVVVLATTWWRMAFVPLVLGVEAVLTAVYLVEKEPIAVSGTSFGIWEMVFRVFGASRLRVLVFVYSLFAFSQQAVLSFLPTLLQINYSFSAEIASGLFAAVFVIGAVVAARESGVSSPSAKRGGRYCPRSWARNSSTFLHYRPVAGPLTGRYPPRRPGMRPLAAWIPLPVERRSRACRFHTAGALVLRRRIGCSGKDKVRPRGEG